MTAWPMRATRWPMHRKPWPCSSAAPPEETSRLQPRGSLRDTGPPPPPLEELTPRRTRTSARRRRRRRGIGRAQAEIGLQRANRLDDVFLFYDPLTYQDNSPPGLKSGRSWVIAMTLPLPIYNRNQGNIAKAHSNLHQTQVELAALERRVVSEVRLAEREYRSLARRARPDREDDLATRTKAPPAKHAGFRGRKDHPPTITWGTSPTMPRRSASFRDALIRHRRSMIDLNTAVGLRVLP